jgi:hypothetical protein
MAWVLIQTLLLPKERIYKSVTLSVLTYAVEPTMNTIRTKHLCDIKVVGDMSAIQRVTSVYFGQ